MPAKPTMPGILVPLDGSPLAEQVLPYAQALIAPGAELILLKVLEAPEPIHGMRGQLLVPLEDVQRMLEHQARDDLKQAEATLRDARPLVRLETAGGNPAEQIALLAAERQVDLIAMTTHGRGALGRWVFGSVADRVARSSPVPVLLLRPSAGEPQAAAIRRLVIPLDGSPMAEEALPVAAALAARLDLPIHLITVIDIMRLIPVELGPVVAFDAAVYQETIDQLDATATAMLTRVSKHLQRAGLQVTTEVAHGSPFAAIADAVQGGDLMVMTSHGHSGVRRWLLGSVAEKLVRESPVPVILVPVAARHSDVPTEHAITN